MRVIPQTKATSLPLAHGKAIPDLVGEPKANGELTMKEKATPEQRALVQKRGKESLEQMTREKAKVEHRAKGKAYLV